MLHIFIFSSVGTSDRLGSDVFLDLKALPVKGSQAVTVMTILNVIDERVNSLSSPIDLERVFIYSYKTRGSNKISILFDDLEDNVRSDRDVPITKMKRSTYKEGFSNKNM